MKLDVGAPADGAPKSLRERIAQLRAQVDDAAASVGRQPSSVEILGVTKRQPRETVLAAIDAGLTDVGESYVQEAHEKYADLPPVRKHFIGHVQTNKAKAIVACFDVVQSIDRPEAARAIARACRELKKMVTVLVQVNISPTERFGIAPERAEELAELARVEGLSVAGVMAIAPRTEDRGERLRAFERAADAFARVGGTLLSLGMSDDFREAIACGSTMVRIGTALFGARG